MSQETDQPILVKLRLRLNDLLRTGVSTPDNHALYQQTILQLFSEFERRKQSCFAQAESLRAQAAAVESQGHAFTAATSLLYNLVNGFVELEEKRIREMHEREEERKASESVVEKVRKPRKKRSVEEAAPAAEAEELSPPENNGDAPHQS